MRVLLFFIIIVFGFQNQAFSQEKNELFEKFIEKKIKYNKQSKKGYSILLYNGNEEEALKTKERFSKEYKKITIKLAYDSPDWKVITPPYSSKLEAEKVYLKIKSLYPNAKIM